MKKKQESRGTSMEAPIESMKPTTEAKGKGGSAGKPRRKSDGAAEGKLRRKDYEKEPRRLQTALCHVQEWVKATGQRIVIIFEGRDAAGKGGTMRAITERCSPRVLRTSCGRIRRSMGGSTPAATCSASFPTNRWRRPRSGWRSAP
jgi:polyphosphate kinase 2 (PPK2 family)